jgi:hypothetical protein
VSDANGRRGRWIDLLQDYSFKIVHRPGMRHANVDALSRNPVGQAMDDEDFHQEIQDDPHTQHGMPEADEEILAVWSGQRVGLRRNKGLIWDQVVHQGSDHRIKQWCSSDLHHLFMIDLVTAPESREEDDPDVGQTDAVGGEDLKFDRGRQRLVKDPVRYYNRRQQLELVLAAQGLSEVGGREIDLKEGVLPETIDPEEGRRARKRAASYCWKEQKLFFKDLYVPEPEERRSLVLQMHEDLGHSGEERLLTEIYRRYFWHCRIEDIKSVVKSCQQCQLVRNEGSVRSGDERLKSIPIYDLFYRVAIDTAGPLPETKAGNKYILVAIDHYSKWCEAKAVADHGAKTAARFLEDDLICRYGVPGFILTDNGGEWGAEFEAMCKDYAIQHQRTAPQWPQCNGMAERMIKTIKHGITVLATNPANVDCWDEHLAKMLFGYRCGVQASTKFSPFMVLTGRSPRLRADNYLSALTGTVDDEVDVGQVAAQFLEKAKLIASIHENVLLNVEQAQKKQRTAYASRRSKHLFEGLVAGETMVKMKRPGKKRALAASWEGPYRFVGHVDGKGHFDFEEGCRLCIVQDADGHQWERSRRDLQIFHVQPD